MTWITPLSAAISACVMFASLTFNGVDPLGYLADVLTRIVNGHPNSKLDDLLPWIYIPATELKAVA